ncbi:MAG: M23 family metallopeptidase, partial [Oscillospiraceae bacterium]|nr:M23 family metallopeptidase [Oscillospiraceae bacterium]
MLAAHDEASSGQVQPGQKVKGTIIADFSVEALAYDETMGDWRTHSGLDIAAPLGTQVLAAANGTVSAIEQDDMLGTVVKIDHGQGLVSEYANLAAVPTVSVGDEVTTGAVIGSVGETAAGESGRQAHLHYALLKDGQAVNPVDYLPKQ